MKNLNTTSIIVLLGFLLTLYNSSNAQFFNKLKKELEKEITKEPDSPANTDKIEEENEQTVEKSQAQEKKETPSEIK